MASLNLHYLSKSSVFTYSPTGDEGFEARTGRGRVVGTVQSITGAKWVFATLTKQAPGFQGLVRNLLNHPRPFTRGKNDFVFPFISIKILNASGAGHFASPGAIEAGIRLMITVQSDWASSRCLGHRRPEGSSPPRLAARGNVDKDPREAFLEEETLEPSPEIGDEIIHLRRGFV